MCPYDSAQRPPPLPPVQSGSVEANLRRQIADLTSHLEQAKQMLCLVKHDYHRSRLFGGYQVTRGRVNYPRGSFQGQTMNNMAHGNGTMTFNNGDTITGDLYNNSWEGYTTKRYANGRVEEGIMRCGKMDGYMKVTSTEKTDVGCMMDGQWHGAMHSRFSNGDVQFSMWDKGQLLGGCIWISNDKSKCKFAEKNSWGSTNNNIIFKRENT